MGQPQPQAERNGLNVQTIVRLAWEMDSDPARARELGQYARKARVRWINGLHSQAYVRDAPPHAYDEPAWLGGRDAAMAASEAVLGAIGGCIAVGFAANATLRDVTVHELEVEVEGTIDLPSFFGLKEGNPGYESINVTLFVNCDAEGLLLQEIVDRAVNLSPVVNTVRRPVSVNYEWKPLA